MRAGNTCSLAGKKKRTSSIPTFLHSDPSLERLLYTVRLSFASCSLGSPSRFCHSCLGRLFYLLYPLHHPLPEPLGLVAEHLSLPTNKVALDLDEFLGLFDTNDFVSKIERAEYRDRYHSISIGASDPPFPYFIGVWDLPWGNASSSARRSDNHAAPAGAAFGGKAIRRFRPSLVASGTVQSFDRSRSATRRAISADASSGIGNTELTLISPST
jgi:hypothetical protein